KRIVRNGPIATRWGRSKASIQSVAMPARPASSRTAASFTSRLQKRDGASGSKLMVVGQHAFRSLENRLAIGTLVRAALRSEIRRDRQRRTVAHAPSCNDSWLREHFCAERARPGQPRHDHLTADGKQALIERTARRSAARIGSGPRLFERRRCVWIGNFLAPLRVSERRKAGEL